MKTKTFEEQSPGTVLLKSPSTWEGLPFSYNESPSNSYVRCGVVDVPLLAIGVAGQAELKYSIGKNELQELWRPGTLAYLDRDYELEKLSTDGKMRALGLELDIPKIEKLTGQDLVAGALFSRNLPRHIFDEDQRIGFLMRAIETEVRNGCPSGALYAESISLAVVSCLWGKYAVRHSIRHVNGLSPAKISMLKDWIKNNISQDISLVQMGNVVGLSPQHLSRCFKQAMGESPYQYLLEIRMNEAKRLLRGGDHSMTEVAFATGYSSPSHFSTAFRKATGMAPTQFQKNI